jgi:hypothetical protein
MRGSMGADLCQHQQMESIDNNVLRNLEKRMLCLTMFLRESATVVAQYSIRR